jgi:rRNA maturation endonuclease Nob1
MKLPFPPLALLLLATVGCINSPDSEAKRAEQMIQLSDALNEVRSTAADLNQTLDSVRVVLAKQDSTIAKLANATGVQVTK